ncbi:T-lymphocyte surface antigen Ly-9 [Gossypium arboreum]|uniref:T-lymphocyte surface antigen Ly-9 n=1 Tax=Gossypium arboreum TaxID=29729 RepID=A0A0B0NG54_GOSAR|nr:T-lymphocyte surface antigen Ly-9 [Gossypium arboreum]
MLRRLPEKVMYCIGLYPFLALNLQSKKQAVIVKYHTIRNVLYMARTEFIKVSRQASGIALSIEREGHTHGFCCTEAGSIWVARHVASLIKNKLAR